MTTLTDVLVNFVSPLIALILFLLISHYYFSKYDVIVKQIRTRNIKKIDKKYKNKSTNTKLFLKYHKEWHTFDDEMEELTNNAKYGRLSGKIVVGILALDALLNSLQIYGVMAYTESNQKILTTGFGIVVFIFILYLWNIYIVMNEQKNGKKK